MAARRTTLTLSTLAAHAGDPLAASADGPAHPAAPSLVVAAAHEFGSIAACDAAIAAGTPDAYVRHGHANGRAFERAVATLEGAEDALTTSSGMSAIAVLVLAHAAAGDTVVVQAGAYGGTTALLRDEIARFGVGVREVDVFDTAALAAALDAALEVGSARRPVLLLVESLSNPLLREADVPVLAAACRSAGVLLAVDATFATPALRRPLGDGADLVLHSATKFLGGHHDLCAGVIAGTTTAIAQMRRVAIRFGTQVAPFDAWLALRGLRTLALRMERAQANATGLAAHLRSHAAVAAVHHPGWGAMVSFDVGSRAAANALVRATRLVTLVPSLGGVTTTLSHPATSSHRALSPAERGALGVTDGLLRVSCGIESLGDVWADLDQALLAID